MINRETHKQINSHTCVDVQKTPHTKTDRHLCLVKHSEICHIFAFVVCVSRCTHTNAHV